MTTTPLRRILLGLLASSTIFVGAAACSDEDGDGGTTDEEIQEGEDTLDSVEDEIDEEIDAQDEGSNEDGE